MEFRFSEEQSMIRDTASAFLEEVSTSAAVRAVMATELGYDAGLWQRICGEMYWQAVHVPESHGGMGLGYVELVAIMEQMGRYLFCSPFHATVCLAGNALLLAGSEQQQAEYLPQLVSGKTATLAWTGGSGRWDCAAIDATWQRRGGDYLLNGRFRYVPDGHSAELLVVAARATGSSGTAGVSLFVLPATTAGIRRQCLPTMDQTRKQAELVFDQVTVPAEALMGEPGEAWPQLQQVIDLATIAIAAEQAGVTRQCLDMTVAHLQERVQFGRAIASFQAVKHKCADMMLKSEAASSAVYYAACIADEALAGGALARELPEAASVSKAYCSDACFFNAGNGIQLFGGVGFTAAYDIQLYFKRARSTEAFLGNAAWHRERLAQCLLDGEDAA
jgi:alkylation response protein AidB-like acyl-CoA dehydrogenase